MLQGKCYTIQPLFDVQLPRSLELPRSLAIMFLMLGVLKDQVAGPYLRTRSQDRCRMVCQCLNRTSEWPRGGALPFLFSPPILFSPPALLIRGAGAISGACERFAHSRRRCPLPTTLSCHLLLHSRAAPPLPLPPLPLLLLLQRQRRGRTAEDRGRVCRSAFCVRPQERLLQESKRRAGHRIHGAQEKSTERY